MRLSHSCCPGKRDINAPEFEECGKPMVLRTGVMIEWRCKGCGTVVYSFESSCNHPEGQACQNCPCGDLCSNDECRCGCH
jgi:hypothetical protein